MPPNTDVAPLNEGFAKKKVDPALGRNANS